MDSPPSLISRRKESLILSWDSTNDIRIGFNPAFEWTHEELCSRAVSALARFQSVGSGSSLADMYEAALETDPIVEQLAYRIGRSHPWREQTYVPSWVTPSIRTIWRDIETLNTAIRRAITIHKTYASEETTFRLMNLPVEVIRNIISYCHSDNRPQSWGSGLDPRPIMALRLTSRALEHLASPFLVPSVTVCVLPESLERLKKISEHPSIGKGVREVRLNLSCFSPRSASHPAWYINSVTHQLGGPSRELRSHSERPYGMLSVEWYKASGMRDLVTTRDNGPTSTVFWEGIRSEISRRSYELLHGGWSFYENLCEKYDEASRDFAPKLADIMETMPMVKQLHISDVACKFDRTNLTGTFQPPYVFDPSRCPGRNDWIERRNDTPTRRFTELDTEYSNWEHDFVAWKVERAIEEASSSRSWHTFEPEDYGDPADSEAVGRVVEILFHFPAQLAARGIDITDMQINISPPPTFQVNLPGPEIPLIPSGLRTFGFYFGKLHRSWIMDVAINVQDRTRYSRTSVGESLQPLQMLLRQYLSAPELRRYSINGKVQRRRRNMYFLRLNVLGGSWMKDHEFKRLERLQIGPFSVGQQEATNILEVADRLVFCRLWRALVHRRTQAALVELINSNMEGLDESDTEHSESQDSEYE